MGVNRRDFLVGSALAGVGLAATAGRAADAPAPQPERRQAVLKISSQEGVLPGKDLNEKLDNAEKWGLEGFEVGSAIGREKQLTEALQNRKIKMAAICMGPLGGNLVSPDPAARARAADEFKRHLTAAGAVGSTGCIFVPCFNGDMDRHNQEIQKLLSETEAGKAIANTAGRKHAEIRKLTVDMLGPIGEHALKCNTRVIIEPLNRGEAWFIRQLADAASICRDTKSDGVCMMGDFYHMSREETNNMGAFISGGKYVRHVHLASYTRVLPGQDNGTPDPNFVPPPPGLSFVYAGEIAKAPDRYTYIEGYRGLKLIGYQHFQSFECGCRGKREEEIPKCVAFLREMWEKATLPV